MKKLLLFVFAFSELAGFVSSAGKHCVGDVSIQLCKLDLSQLLFRVPLDPRTLHSPRLLQKSLAKYGLKLPFGQFEPILYISLIERMDNLGGKLRIPNPLTQHNILHKILKAKLINPILQLFLFGIDVQYWDL